MIPVGFINAMRAFIALAAVVVFVFVGWDALQDVMGAENGKVPTYGDWDLYILTALSALVGGVVAVAFGQSAPPIPPPPSPPAPTLGELTTENLRGLGRSVSFGKAASAGIGIIYVLVYMALGLAACIVWRANPDEVSQPVQNLGLTFVGMMLPIAQGFFSSPPTT